MEIKSTKQVAVLIGVKPNKLQRAVWEGRISEPKKGPGNSFYWTEADINRASKALLNKPYRPEATGD
ncbi:MAG: helix-turn-helix domain-containing protein [Planctomycetes bacterium]|nr:helix-turn-helix domain-containing protein [Planctomycetota bacterium]